MIDDDKTIPQLLHPLLWNGKRGKCYSMLEPLALRACPTRNYEISVHSFMLNSIADVYSSVNNKTVVLGGMHFDLRLNLNILSLQVECTQNNIDCHPKSLNREDFLVIFVLPKNAFVDTYELKVSQKF